MYKLEINSYVDERRDPVKATQAAVRYLNDLYAIYEDWILVIAAYNCGPGMSIKRFVVPEEKELLGYILSSA